MSPTVYWTLVGLFMGTVTLFVLISTGSFLSVLVLWILVAVVVGVLVYYGYVDLVPPKAEPAEPTETEKPAAMATGGGPLVGSEVFNIADQRFTYEEAEAVCTAYDATLATLEQVIDAFNSGAEWCNYGWSVGGMALYPTQKATWERLQRELDPKKRTACGRPGVNGGYFDPMTKFGVNCFGFKPEGTFKPPAPPPGIDQLSFAAMVQKFKDLLKTLTVLPFSRKEWSGHATGGEYGKQFQQAIGNLKESFTEYANEFSENIDAATAAYTASPYGLRGAQGPKGDMGPEGPPGVGVQGPMGTAGPEGPPGPTGPQGPEGQKGADGVSNLPGPTGPAGTSGKDGNPGKDGAPGPTGPMGATGPAGGGGTGAGEAEVLRVARLARGDLTNFTACASDTVMKNIGLAYPHPNETQPGKMDNDTRWWECEKYYNDPSWLSNDTRYDLKRQYRFNTSTIRIGDSYIQEYNDWRDNINYGLWAGASDVEGGMYGVGGFWKAIAEPEANRRRKATWRTS